MFDVDSNVGYNNSLSSLAPVVNVRALCFGNILQCTNDRMIWNAIALSNKDIYKQSKTILPPWPLFYKLASNFFVHGHHVVHILHIACVIGRRADITIFDQRHGPLHNHLNAHSGNIITNLKCLFDGSYLVSVGSNKFIRLWDKVTGNYKLLQEWNTREEIAGEVLR